MMMNNSLYQGQNILLVSPPVYDYRLDWSKWHQPTGLLQLGRFLLQKHKDVRLIDCLHTERGKHLPRHKIGTQEIEGYTLQKWHFGQPLERIKSRIKGLSAQEWTPDTVFVTCMNSVWWESARDTIKLLKELLPQAKIILGGTYPVVEPEHAVQYSGAHEVVTSNIPEVARLAPDLSLYEEIPYSAGIYFYTCPGIHKPADKLRPRSPNKIVKEIRDKAQLGVREFVFFDEEIQLRDRDAFGELLDEIATADLDVHFVLAGNASPHVIDRSLARKLHRARVTQVYLRCDLQPSLSENPYITPLEEYERCTDALVNAGGFKWREDGLAAMLVAGLPFEDLEAISEKLVRLAHIVGSAILVPFQYVPSLHRGPRFDRALSQNGSFSPEKFNSKLFLLARLSGKSFEEYWELTRLAALLNSRYRSRTFDFLGQGLTAKMFRESIRTEGWNPFREQVGVNPFLEVLPVSVTEGN